MTAATLKRPELSQASRARAAKAGKALPGGGYPIRNPRELRAARRLAGKSKRYSKAVIQAHIRRRARALGVKLSADQSAAIDLAIDAGLLTIDLAGHWRHNWVPLDAAAIASKNHGRKPKGGRLEHSAVTKLGLSEHHNAAKADTAAVIRRAAILHVAGRHKAAQQHLEQAKRAGHPDAERLTRIQKKLRLHAAGYRAAAMSLSADGLDFLDLAGKWRHGWIPLDAVAALSKAKGNHARAARYVKPPRKTAAHIAEYRQLRQAQDRRFESHHGAGVSVADTRTPEYQAYFGTGEHAGSTHRVEQRVTFRGHLANLAAQKQDSKERAHSFRLGHQLGRQHAKSKESSAVQDKQYETVSQRAAHEGHFAEGYSAGLAHQPTPRAKPAPVAAGKGRAGTSVTSAIQVGKGGRSKSDISAPAAKRNPYVLSYLERTNNPGFPWKQQHVIVRNKAEFDRKHQALLARKDVRHLHASGGEPARTSTPPRVDKLATKRDTGGMTSPERTVTVTRTRTAISTRLKEAGAAQGRKVEIRNVDDRTGGHLGYFLDGKEMPPNDMAKELGVPGVQPSVLGETFRRNVTPEARANLERTRAAVATKQAAQKRQALHRRAGAHTTPVVRRSKPAAPSTSQRDANLGALEVRKAGSHFEVYHKPSGLRVSAANVHTKAEAEALRQAAADTHHDLTGDAKSLQANREAMKHVSGATQEALRVSNERASNAAAAARARKTLPPGGKVTNPSRPGDLAVFSKTQHDYQIGKGSTAHEEHIPVRLTHVSKEGHAIGGYDAAGHFRTIDNRTTTRVLPQDKMDVPAFMEHVKQTNRWHAGSDSVKPHYGSLEETQRAAKQFATQSSAPSAPTSHISAQQAFRMSGPDLKAAAAKGDPVATAELRRRADKKAGKTVPARVTEPAGRPKAEARGMAGQFTPEQIKAGEARNAAEKAQNEREAAAFKAETERLRGGKSIEQIRAERMAERHTKIEEHRSLTRDEATAHYGLENIAHKSDARFYIQHAAQMHHYGKHAEAQKFLEEHKLRRGARTRADLTAAQRQLAAHTPAAERRRELTRRAASSTPPVVRRSKPSNGGAKPEPHTAAEVQAARMTYRERRMARAERLRGWSEKRQTAAAQVFKAGEPYRSDNAFNTQPGHIPFRARLIAREDRAHDSVQKAQGMAERARSIEAQAAGAIYSDDPHAIPALQERIAKLEKQREQIKARNAAYRKEHKAELAKLTPYGRDRAMPHQSYELTNLGGNISRQRKRLEQLQRQAARK